MPGMKWLQDSVLCMQTMQAKESLSLRLVKVSSLCFKAHSCVHPLSMQEPGWPL